MLPGQVTMDQLTSTIIIYWYEVGMLKVYTFCLGIKTSVDTTEILVD